MMTTLISDDPRIQASYEEMLAAGESPRLAEMLAFRAPPMSNTDREFMEGRWEKTSPILNGYRKYAESLGVTTSGRVYQSGLAEYPGDPRAWVGGRGEVTQILEERGWGASGSVTVKPRDTPPPDPVGVAPDIIERETVKALLAHPEPERVNVAELKAEIYEQRKPHWAK